MKLQRVTMTGADDGTELADLFSLTGEYPFVEWGILMSASQEGTPRWPSQKWIRQIHDHAAGFSLHLCGKWLRDLLIGKISFPIDLAAKFERMQLNFHGGKIIYKRDEFVHALAQLPIKKFIFQIDGNMGQQLLAEVEDGRQSFECFPLHDVSHGAGIAPDKWPSPLNDGYEGYAGGIGPDTIIRQINNISKVVGNDQPIWIDMETRVRSNSDKLFDLTKVKQCLELASSYVE